MKSILTFLIVLLSMLFIASCSQRLSGTWQVQKYETNIEGEQNISLLDVGSITFNNDGTGVKDIKFSVLGVTKVDTTTFHWTKTDNQITINSKNSDFGKTWIIMKSNRHFQKWKSTDGTNQIQLLELVK